MTTSGHTPNFIRRALIKGLCKYLKKVRRSELPVSNPGFQPLYMHARWKRNERKKEQILKKLKWFKPGDEGKGDLPDLQPAGTKGKRTKQVLKDGVEVKTVVFVPSTRGGS